MLGSFYAVVNGVELKGSVLVNFLIQGFCFHITLFYSVLGLGGILTIEYLCEMGDISYHIHWTRIFLVEFFRFYTTH